MLPFLRSGAERVGPAADVQVQGMGTGLPQPPWGAAAKVLHGAPAAKVLPLCPRLIHLDFTPGFGEV